MKKTTITEKYENGKLVERVTVEETDNNTWPGFEPIPNYPQFPAHYPVVTYSRDTLTL